MTKTSPADLIIKNWLEITRLLRHRMAGANIEKKMNPMQVHALMVIKEHDNLTMKEFAEFLHITSPSATSLVNRLVRMKWVKRNADKLNRKLVRLKLSQEGVKYLSAKMKVHMGMMRDLFSLLSVSDQREFARILGALRTTLSKNTHTK